MSGYSNGNQITYTQAAFAGGTSAGQSVLKFAGPPGLTGRLTSMIAVVTTEVTGAVSAITLRNNVTTADIYGSIVVSAAVVELVASGALAIDDVSDTPTHVGRIPADAVLELDGDGGNTAGAVTVQFTIEWS